MSIAGIEDLWPTTSDYNLVNATGTTIRSDINNMVSAIHSMNSVWDGRTPIEAQDAGTWDGTTPSDDTTTTWDDEAWYNDTGFERGHDGY